MHPYCIIGRIFIFSLVIVSASTSDLTSPSIDDSIFQNTDETDLSLSPSDSNLPSSPFDQDQAEAIPYSSSLASSPFLGDEQQQQRQDLDPFFTSDTVLDDPLDIADCSASNDLPLVSKKSRARRRDESNGMCKNPNEATGHLPSLSEDGAFPDQPTIKFLLNNPSSIVWLTADMADSRKNRYCHWLTAGLLPFGVCSSGSAEDQRMSISDPLSLPPFGEFGAFGLWSLTHVTLGMFFDFF